MKACSKCLQEKPTSEFHKDRYAKDGLRSICRNCASVANKAFRNAHPDYGKEWAANNAERTAEYAKRWRLNHPEKAKAASRRYAANHPEKMSENTRRFREANPTYFAEWNIRNRERRNERQRQRYWNDPEKARARARRDVSKRRAIIKGSVEHEMVDHWLVYNRDKGICGICFLPAPPDAWQLDHIIPVSRSGPHTYENTRVSHSECNSWKHDRLDEECGPVPGHIVAIVWERWVGRQAGEAA